MYPDSPFRRTWNASGYVSYSNLLFDETAILAAVLGHPRRDELCNLSIGKRIVVPAYCEALAVKAIFKMKPDLSENEWLKVRTAWREFDFEVASTNIIATLDCSLELQERYPEDDLGFTEGLVLSSIRETKFALVTLDMRRAIAVHHSYEKLMFPHPDEAIFEYCRKKRLRSALGRGARPRPDHYSPKKRRAVPLKLLPGRHVAP